MKTYDILELQKLTPAELHEVGEKFEIDPEIKSRQEKIYAILQAQNQIISNQ